MWKHKWGIYVPRAETTGEPLIIGPFDTFDEAQKYLEASQTERHCDLIPVVEPVAQPLEDADL